MHQVLEKLVSTVVAQMPLLLKVVDNIALLDMLLAFFSAISGVQKASSKHAAATSVQACRCTDE